MSVKNYSRQKLLAAHQFIKEKEYWLSKFPEIPPKSHFTYDYHLVKANNDNDNNRRLEKQEFEMSGELFTNLMKLSAGSDYTLNIILAAGITLLLYRYTGNNDITIGAPIYKQDIEGEFSNTALALRNSLAAQTTFKEFLLQMRQTIIKAIENQNYPIEMLAEALNEELNVGEPEIEEFKLFEIAVLVENIQDRSYIQHLPLNMVFSFFRQEHCVAGVIEYNGSLYHKITIERIINCFRQLLQNALNNINEVAVEIEILSPEEKKQLLIDFNATETKPGLEKTIPELFERQVEKTPDHIALIAAAIFITYSELNQKANQLAHLLKRNGVTTESVVGIMIEPQAEMVVGLLGILKAGGAYLPIDTHLPAERVRYLLEDSGATVLVTTGQAVKEIPFTELQGFEYNRYNRDMPFKVTPPRSYIAEFDQLPHPNRRLINLRNYKNKIGMASVTNCVSLQATRGCPYHCLFCHKIWSKHHIYRSAENIYSEIEYYYRHGVTHFAFIDDCFNLNIEKSRKVFESILKNDLKIRLFFPNGLRGDILTPDYIDLMVEAGARGINLSLETASPRLQTLLKKNLDLDKFKQVMDYIASRHPQVILEMASMHGFPGETEEEATMTLDFIKSIHWLHFPYLHILKIFPNTEMEAFALEQGIPKRDIMLSKNRAFHELPETLPFPKSFTRKFQTDFLNNYFLNKERLRQVLPHQMNVLSEAALVQKYNAYLPVEIKRIEDLFEFTQVGDLPTPDGYREEPHSEGTIFDWEAERQEIKPGAKKILLLDLSQHFSSHHMLYRVVEQPLGLICLLTHLNERFGNKIDGRIYKSGNDFDSFEELKTLVDEYRPDLVGIRTLTFFKEFFHETVSLLRQWGVKCPIITGGPYASSDYDTILKDSNVDLVVFGEGEYTLEELIREMFNNDFQWPAPAILGKIQGIAYAVNSKKMSTTAGQSREVILLDRLRDVLLQEKVENPGPVPGKNNLEKTNLEKNNLAYVMYTSGSTGRPKGVMVEYGQVNNCISWMQDKFNLAPGNVIVNRTNLTFDPSVWEIFWPLYLGGKVKILDAYQRKDAEYLIRLMAEDTTLTMMYCPATMVNIITYLLNKKTEKPNLKLPWLIIGAEPIAMDVVKNFYQYFAGKIVNTYGPTECTINNTYYDLDRLDGRPIVPIGKPVANNKIYILSPDLKLMPVNVAGEIHIAGSSVARGYINNIEKTGAHFIENPFGAGMLYKTGDIGRWLDDGVIEIMGRVDEQVKIRGYRIELGEIRAALLEHKGISDCIVTTADSKYPETQNNDIRVCKSCGVTTKYPRISVNDDGLCEICTELAKYQPALQAYFKTLGDLEKTIREANEANKTKPGAYDCLLLYSGGRGAANALYRLHDMGFKILAATYDNGYMGKANIANIKMITSKLNIDHVMLTHKNTVAILRESMKTAHTVCRGCFLTSSSLAAEYAFMNNINVVVGATLSRGQIIDNKLFMFLQQGITDANELEVEFSKFQLNIPQIEKSYFDLLDIDVVNDGSVYKKVKFLDFYRYCDMTNDEMIAYLNERDPYWQTRKTVALYSTNCPIKQIGDYGHLQERGFHFYGSATSWEKRLGHLSLTNLKEDLEYRITPKGFANFLKRIQYDDAPKDKKDKQNKKEDNYLCAYFIPDKSSSETDFSASELRNFLLQKLPAYMIPNYFMPLEQIPLTANGKVDRKALPLPKAGTAKVQSTYVAPSTDLEKSITDTWREVLGIDKVGIQDNFFDLGGNSLNIIMAGTKLKETLAREIPVVTLFTYPTVHSLAQHLEHQEQGVNNEPGQDGRQAQQLDKAQEKIKNTAAKIKNMRRQN